MEANIKSKVINRVTKAYNRTRVENGLHTLSTSTVSRYMRGGAYKVPAAFRAFLAERAAA